MYFIRFEVEGLLNSFRVPFFRAYHKTFCAPPKTTIVGMLCNISLKSQRQFFNMLDEELVDASVVINKIGGRFKELWSYKTLSKENHGKNIVRREKLWLPSYTIYLCVKNETLFNELFESLKSPKNIPSLGLDDELVTISGVTILNEHTLIENDSRKIDSVFLNKDIKYKVLRPECGEILEFPTPNLVPVKFLAFDNKDNRISRENRSEFLQIEYLNCEIELLSDIKSFKDVQTGKRIIFY